MYVYYYCIVIVSLRILLSFGLIDISSLIEVLYLCCFFIYCTVTLVLLLRILLWLCYPWKALIFKLKPVFCSGYCVSFDLQRDSGGQDFTKKEKLVEAPSQEKPKSEPSPPKPKFVTHQYILWNFSMVFVTSVCIFVISVCIFVTLEQVIV
jgi:hypothetical protein